MYSEVFQIAAGSVPGRDHLERDGLLIGRNNQDAFSIREALDGSWLVAMVCDGCGSKPHSDVGANIGARLLASCFAARLERLQGRSIDKIDAFFETVRKDFLAELRSIALQLSNGVSFTKWVADHLLFTTIGILLFEESVIVFNVGDGLYSINGEVHEIGPFPGNRPPYLAYELIGSSFDSEPEQLRFTTRAFELAQFEHGMIGSDGVSHLLNAESKMVPGQSNAVGPLAQFWEQDRFFKISDGVRRRLALINSQVTQWSPEKKRVVTEQGHLPDDTTLLVIRRTPLPLPDD